MSHLWGEKVVSWVRPVQRLGCQDRLPIEPFARVFFSLSLWSTSRKCRSSKCHFAQMSLNRIIDEKNICKTGRWVAPNTHFFKTEKSFFYLDSLHSAKERISHQRLLILIVQISTVSQAAIFHLNQLIILRLVCQNWQRPKSVVLQREKEKEKEREREREWQRIKEIKMKRMEWKMIK